MLRFLFLFLASAAMGYDEQLSIYGYASTTTVTDPGYGIEFATTLGQRTSLGFGVNTTSVTQETYWPDLIHVQGRLIYNAESRTHWYPIGELQWQLDKNTYSGLLGIGVQHEWLREIGVTMEALWRSADDQLILKAGLRIWPMRLSSLDSRIKASDPIGAVYTGGPVSVQAPSKDLRLEEPTAQKSESPAAEPTRDYIVPPVRSNDSSEEPVNELATVSIAWFVNLGVFQQESSMHSLIHDSRLKPYRPKLESRFDASQQSYRLVIGPFSRPEAMRAQRQLRAEGLANFLIELPIRPDS